MVNPALQRPAELDHTYEHRQVRLISELITHQRATDIDQKCLATTPAYWIGRNARLLSTIIPGNINQRLLQNH